MHRRVKSHLNGFSLYQCVVNVQMSVFFFYIQVTCYIIPSLDVSVYNVRARIKTGCYIVRVFYLHTVWFSVLFNWTIIIFFYLQQCFKFVRVRPCALCLVFASRLLVLVSLVSHFSSSMPQLPSCLPACAVSSPLPVSSSHVFLSCSPVTLINFWPVDHA